MGTAIRILRKETNKNGQIATSTKVCKNVYKYLLNVNNIEYKIKTFKSLVVQRNILLKDNLKINIETIYGSTHD